MGHTAPAHDANYYRIRTAVRGLTGVTLVSLFYALPGMIENGASALIAGLGL